MKSTSKTPKLRRFAAVLAVIAALMVTALTPALVVSLVLTQDAGQQIEQSEHAATIDVTDVDSQATVMYTVSPSDGVPHDSDVDFTIPTDILKDADLIKVTVSDDDNIHSFFESQTRDDCSFTLHLSDDDRYSAQTRHFTGYLRITDEETARMAGSDVEEFQNCGLYVIYAD